MELKEHWKIIKSAWIFIIIFTIVVVATAGIYVYLKPTVYNAQLDFEVELVNRAQTNQYQYGAYYDMKGAELYVQHIMSWFITPSIIKEIYAAAGLSTEGADTGRFTTKQYSSQNFVIKFSDSTKDGAEKLASAVAQAVVERNDNNQFQIKYLGLTVSEAGRGLKLILGVSLLSGLAIAVLLVYLKRYFS